MGLLGGAVQTALTGEPRAMGREGSDRGGLGAVEGSVEPALGGGSRGGGVVGHGVGKSDRCCRDEEPSRNEPGSGFR